MITSLTHDDQARLQTALWMFEEILKARPDDTEALDVINEACHLLEQGQQNSGLTSTQEVIIPSEDARFLAA